MTPAELTSLFLKIFGLILLGLIAIIWFVVKAWLRVREQRDLKEEKNYKDLTTAMDGLKEAIWKLREQFVLRTDYDRDMALLRVGGRRATDTVCPQEDCPLQEPPNARTTRPGRGAPGRD